MIDMTCSISSGGAKQSIISLIGISPVQSQDQIISSGAFCGGSLEMLSSGSTPESSSGSGIVSRKRWESSVIRSLDEMLFLTETLLWSGLKLGQIVVGYDMSHEKWLGRQSIRGTSKSRN
jgi:hypothetical protein